MSVIVVSPLARIAEMAVRHKAREMISLLAANQDFHRPAVIQAERHLKLAMNDISFAGTGDLIAPQEKHVVLADGTTIAYVPSATIVQKLTMPGVPFDPMTDIAPITLAGTVQTAFCVSPTIGVNNLRDYVEWLKKNPTK